MKINGAEGLSVADVQSEISKGGKFVVFQYCISILIMTFKRGSDIYFIKANEGTFGKSIGYTLVSLVLGWWGIPWGPIYTIGSVITNLSGGKDVTNEIIVALNLPKTTTNKNIQSTIPTEGKVSETKKSKTNNFFDDYPNN